MAAWLPGLEPKGEEGEKVKQRKRRRPNALTPLKVPLEVEIVPGMKVLVLARVDGPKKRRDDR